MHWVRNQHNVNTIIMSIPVFRKYPSTLILYINFILIDMCEILIILQWNIPFFRISQFQRTLAQCILGWRGFKFVKRKVYAFSQREIITKYSENTLTKFKNLLQNHWTNFNQTWHNSSLGEGNSSLIKWVAPPFFKGR